MEDTTQPAALEGEVLPRHVGTIGHVGISRAGTMPGGLLSAALMLAATQGGIHAAILDDAMGFTKKESDPVKTLQDLDRMAAAHKKRERKLRRNRELA